MEYNNPKNIKIAIINTPSGLYNASKNPAHINPDISQITLSIYHMKNNVIIPKNRKLNTNIGIISPNKFFLNKLTACSTLSNISDFGCNIYFYFLFNI
jgi:hypothetical protein